MNDAVKLAKIQAQQENYNRLFDLLEKPAISIVLAFALIEGLQAVELGKGRQLMGSAAGTMLEIGLVTTPVLTALANSDILKGLLAARTGGLSEVLALGAGKS